MKAIREEKAVEEANYQRQHDRVVDGQAYNPTKIKNETSPLPKKGKHGEQKSTKGGTMKKINQPKTCRSPKRVGYWFQTTEARVPRRGRHRSWFRKWQMKIQKKRRCKVHEEKTNGSKEGAQKENKKKNKAPNNELTGRGGGRCLQRMKACPKMKSCGGNNRKFCEAKRMCVRLVTDHMITSLENKEHSRNGWD